MKSILIMHILFIFVQCHSTNMMYAEPPEWLKNGKLDYEISNTRLKVDENNPEEVDLSKYIVEVQLNEKQKKWISELDKRQILSLLKEDQYDYSMNLILYSYFERDAMIIGNIKMEDWKMCCKKKDIKFWKRKLKGTGIIKL